MKVTKSLLKTLINEELNRVLSEQTGFAKVMGDVGTVVATQTGAGKKKKKKQANFQGVIDDTAGEVAAATGATPMSGGGSAKPQRTEIPSQQRSLPQQAQSSAASTQAQMRANAKKQLMQLAKTYAANPERRDADSPPDAEEIKYVYDSFLENADGDLAKAVELIKQRIASSGSRIASGKGPSTRRAGSNTVKALQQALIDAGISVGRTGADGKMGRNTRAGMKKAAQRIAKIRGRKFANKMLRSPAEMLKFMKANFPQA